MAPSRLRDALDGLAPHARRFLNESIAFASTHGNEADAVAHARTCWADAGFDVETHPIPEDIKQDPEYTRPETDLAFEGRENLVVRTRGTGGGRSVAINSHLDVVPAEGWEEAFTPRAEEETIYGRGACDAKGSVAAMYLAARALRELDLQPAGDVIWQMVIDEEVGGNGSLALIREGVDADGAVVMEPTELAMHPANRGAIWFRFEFRGTPCHMGRKHEGVNALDLAREAMGILYEYEKELIADRDDQPLFAHYAFPSQVNVGILRGGEWPSMVAGSATMEGGVGFLPGRSMDQVKEDIARYIRQKGSQELKDRHTLTFPALHNDSYETPPDHPFVRAFHRATLLTSAQETVTGWNVSCDARLFARVGDLPTVVFGPGRVEDAHSEDEKVEFSRVVAAAETLVRFIEIWCTREDVTAEVV